MKIDISFFNFIKRNLPAHKIQKNRVSLYYTFFAELDILFEKWKAFRGEKAVEQNINHSRDSIVFWLHNQIGDTTLRIIENVVPENFMLLSPQGGGFFVNLSEDGNVNDDFVELGRQNDTIEGSLDADFVVISSNQLTAQQKQEIGLIVERYRAAGVTYKIKDNE